MDASTRQCPHCSEILPAQARFCSACSQLLPPLAAGEYGGEQGGLGAPLMPGAEETVASSLAANAPTAAEEPQAGADSASTPPDVAQAGTTTLPGEAPAAGHGPRSMRPGSLLRKLLIAVLVIVLVAAGAGAIVYVVLLPRPVISVTSDKQASGTLAGGVDTVLHVRGQKFSANSEITFLLDGQVAPDTDRARSDKDGAVKADLTISENWLLGKHTLTARDAKNYVTNDGVPLLVVPQPKITVTSRYQTGTTPAGGANTVFHVSGKGFSYQSTITFLLDGQPVPAGQPAQSDERGRVQADLTATGDWTLGNHMLTAQDAQGNAPQTGVAIAIVAPGEAGTPGPNGAPTNEGTFMLFIKKQDSSLGQPESLLLNITGQPGMNSGKVCSPLDNGQPVTSDESPWPGPGGGTFHETFVATCSGTYQGGKLTYTEMLTSDEWVFSFGGRCVERAPIVFQSLTGVFSSATQISGIWSREAGAFNCTRTSFQFATLGGHGTWTGITQP